MTAKLEKQVTKLQAALEAEKTRSADALEKEKGKFQGLSKPASKVRAAALALQDVPLILCFQARPRVPSVIEEVSEGEISQETPPKPRTRNQKPASTRSEKADTKGKAREKATRLPSEAADEPQRKNGKEQAQQNVLDEGELLEIEDEDSVQETSLPVKKRGRPRGQDLDSEIEEVPPPPKNTRSKAGQSRRSEDDTEATKKPRFKPDKRKEVDDDELPKKRARDKPPSTSAGQGAAKPPSTRVDTEEEEGPQKKKKRKLNLAGGNIFAGPAGFTWNQVGSFYLFLMPYWQVDIAWRRTAKETWAFQACCRLSKMGSLFLHGRQGLVAFSADGKCLGDENTPFRSQYTHFTRVEWKTQEENKVN